MGSVRGTTSLLHLERPLSPAHTAQHYLGWPPGALDARLAEHAAGRGARFTQAAVERRIGWELVRTWDGGTRVDERRHKTGAHGCRLCPRCRSCREAGMARGGKCRTVPWAARSTSQLRVLRPKYESTTSLRANYECSLWTPALGRRTLIGGGPGSRAAPACNLSPAHPLSQPRSR